MRGTGIHLWLLNTGELACDLKSVISEAVSWKSSRNRKILYFNRTNNLPLIYLYVWLTLLDWIRFAIDDLISGHICFHSYHCCVHVWKVTSIQFRFRDILCWTYWCVVNVGWWMIQKGVGIKGKLFAHAMSFWLLQGWENSFGSLCENSKSEQRFFLKLLEVKGGFGRQTRLG